MEYERLQPLFPQLSTPDIFEAFESDNEYDEGCNDSQGLPEARLSLGELLGEATLMGELTIPPKGELTWTIPPGELTMPDPIPARPG